MYYNEERRIVQLKRRKMAEKKMDPALWIFIVYLALIVVMYRLSPMITGALILGLYLSMIIMVPAKIISKPKFISERVSLILSSILVFAVLVITIYQIFPIIIDEASKLFETLTSTEIVIDEIIDQLPVFLQNAISSGQSTGFLSEQLSKLVSAFSSFGMSLLNDLIPQIPNVVTGLVIFVIAATYLTTLKPLFRDNLWRFFPASTRNKSTAFVRGYYASIRAFINGQLIIAFIVGIIVGGGMAIAGIPYALFLGFLAGITNLIPFFGVIITAIPAIFLGLAHYGAFGLLRVGIVLILANQIESWVLSPKIQGDRMQLNWFVILLGILLFGGLFGFVGVLFAVPIMVFIKEFWIQYVQEEFKRN